MARSSKNDIAHLFSEENKTKFKRVEKKIKTTHERKKNVSGKTNVEDETERLTRTIFVGNVPATVNPSELKRFFRDAGKVETVRIRSLAVTGAKVEQAGNQGAVRKACFITGALNADISTCNAYVVFANVRSIEKALDFNGKLFNDHHLSVDRATASGEGTKRNDHRRSVFVGNICFTASEEDLYRFFLSQVGDDSVDRVRLIRDPETRMGKGIGYVSFKSPMGVLSALALDGTEFQGRKLRVKRCKKTASKEPFQGGRGRGRGRERGRGRGRGRGGRGGRIGGKRKSSSFYEGSRATAKNQKAAMKRIAKNKNKKRRKK